MDRMQKELLGLTSLDVVNSKSIGQKNVAEGRKRKEEEDELMQGLELGFEFGLVQGKKEKGNLLGACGNLPALAHVIKDFNRVNTSKLNI